MLCVHTDPWGFMIQFDERAYFSNGWVKNHATRRIFAEVLGCVSREENFYCLASRRPKGDVFRHCFWSNHLLRAF